MQVTELIISSLLLIRDLCKLDRILFCKFYGMHVGMKNLDVASDGNIYDIRLQKFLKKKKDVI